MYQLIDYKYIKGIYTVVDTCMYEWDHKGVYECNSKGGQHI